MLLSGDDWPHASRIARHVIWGLFDDHRHDLVLPAGAFDIVCGLDRISDVEVVVDQVVLQPESTGALVRKVKTIWDVSRSWSRRQRAGVHAGDT